jgi:hypothetical protein
LSSRSSSFIGGFLAWAVLGQLCSSPALVVLVELELARLAGPGELPNGVEFGTLLAKTLSFALNGYT